MTDSSFQLFEARNKDGHILQIFKQDGQIVAHAERRAGNIWHIKHEGDLSDGQRLAVYDGKTTRLHDRKIISTIDYDTLEKRLESGAATVVAEYNDDYSIAGINYYENNTRQAFIRPYGNGEWGHVVSSKASQLIYELVYAGKAMRLSDHVLIDANDVTALENRQHLPEKLRLL